MSMDRNYKLYVHISPSSKRYYGITCQSNTNQRWRNGKGYKSNQYFTKAINKYGWDNFEHIVLFDNLTKEEAKLLEQCYIALYDTTNPEYGYNCTLGGEGMNGYKTSDETKVKLSKAMKNRVFTEEHRKKISEAKKGENNYFYGMVGKDNPNASRVRNKETGEIFDTVNEASKSVKRSRQSITQAIRTGGKCGGYHWERIA